jgi:two-component system sensor histidine kinase YesM
MSGGRVKRIFPAGAGGVFRSLSVNVFLMILIFLLIPIYISLMIIKASYENSLQEELNRQIIENIKKGEEEFYQTFQMMTNISNVFVLDRDLISVLADKDSSYWVRNKRFDEIANSLRINNLVNLNNIKITMFDRYNRNYANWGLYFHDYSGILEEEWVNRSIENKGLISWNLFAPSFVQQENEQYISLARSVLNPAYSGDWIGTIIISINQRAINAILSRNDMNADFTRISTRETVEDVFALDGVNLVQREDLQRLLLETAGAGSGGMLCELDGRRYLLSYYTLDSPWTFNGQRLTVLCFSDYERISENLSRLSRTINFRMALFIIILIVIIGIISYTIAKPIRLLDKRVKHYTQTREISVFGTSRTDEIGDLTRTFQDMEIRINDLFEKLRRESEIREQYRFQALRAQINPHFLFNTLNTIRWMAAIRKAGNIVDTINALSRILDYSMSRSGDTAALGDELDMIRSYAHIQNYRYGEDWEVNIEIGGELLNYWIVRFILQPIVENAFIHAFRNRSGKKIIHITGQKEPDRLLLFVRDNGAGMGKEKLNELRKSLDQEDQPGNRGIGIVSVHRRIRAGYGGDFGLDFESVPGEGTLVIFNLPLIAEGGYEKAVNC